MTHPLAQHIREFPVGTVLFRQGEAGKNMYVIQQGKIEISRKAGDKETVLAVFPPGEFFGEMSILNDAPRSATAKVVEDAHLLVIDSNTFETMIRDSTEIAVRMIKKLSYRLEQTSRQMDLLMFRDPNTRVVHRLRQLSEEGGELRPEGVAVNAGSESLAEHLGLSQEEVDVVLQRLERARLVTRLGEKQFAIAEVGKLQDFLDFLEMKERYGGA
ncbi:MAG: Crp/Fnr family transcriptional regulator [Deltaproteobacteria bacterium]|nr:Crp/Fnr family transcriptional regulator [Deltaproteobacteria bacterium]